MERIQRNLAASIRMGEMRVAQGGDHLRTILGSCVGLALYDRQQKIGGLAHIVLPDSGGKTDRPGKFADTAIPELIAQMNDLADAELKLTARLAGGASMFSHAPTANVGLQNVDACKQQLRELEIPILGEDCGGRHGRRMIMEVETGKVSIEIVGRANVVL